MDRRFFFAVDIGNTRIKCGRFPWQPTSARLPVPEQVVSILPATGNWEALEEVLKSLPEQSGTLTWWIASVNRPATTDLVEFLRLRRASEKVFLLTSQEIPIPVSLPHPDRVGIDRLAAAVAADTLRHPKHPAIVVDVGTAITVDVLSSHGSFEGGAIACGPAIAARALYEFTDLLPQIETVWTSPPPPIGHNTQEAMAAGVFWGMVGTVRELIFRQTEHISEEPDIFVTGGGGALLASLLGGSARFVEHLTLSGIALTVYSYLAHHLQRGGS
ncbi:type III pantothenate kinase [Thermogutta sp.]|uniref:type III pantothenate kinase n=1 Tax=Thermogutta sp. TaxID=1962930 RepID=UPI003C7DDBCB